MNIATCGGNVNGAVRSVLFENIPEELTRRASWVAWRFFQKEGQAKPAKVPFTPTTGHSADSSRPETGGTFAEAKAAYELGGWDGVGFILDPHSKIYGPHHIIGVDLDGCRDPETGKMENWAWAIINALGSYAEVSPSGTGVRIFLFGKKPGKRCRRDNVEIYDRSRFLTVTGHVIVDPLGAHTSSLRHNQDGLDAVYAQYLGASDPVEQAQANPDICGPGNSLTVEQVIALGKQSEKFVQLWDGDWSDFSSRSEAEQSLMNRLAYLAAGDQDKMMKAFRLSGLYMDKCERTCPMYTIPNAIQGRDGHFYLDAAAMFDVVEMERPPDLSARMMEKIRGAILTLAEFRKASPPPKKIYLVGPEKSTQPLLRPSRCAGGFLCRNIARP